LQIKRLRMVNVLAARVESVKQRGVKQNDKYDFINKMK
jgi:hypothetical protein